VELSEKPGAFSDLIGSPVRDQSGRALGRVFEVRAHWERDGSIVLDELMTGGRALWRRLRGPGYMARGIPWANVIEIGDKGITVRPPG
jgi:sporulation protein YlmC with PRC-barrel domain